MMEAIRGLRVRFGTTRMMAAFMGVEVVTVQSWISGIRKPSGEAARLLEVLVELAHADPFVFGLLVGKQGPSSRTTVRTLPAAAPMVRTVTPAGNDATPAEPATLPGKWYTQAQFNTARAFLLDHGCPEDQITDDMVERVIRPE